MRKLLCLFAFFLLLSPFNVQAAPLTDEYTVSVTTTQIDTYSWHFEYAITNNNQTTPDLFWIGLGGFWIWYPQGTIISNISAPDPYWGSPGFWSIHEGATRMYFHGNEGHSLYPQGKTAYFSFQADGVIVGKTHGRLLTYWHDFNAPGSFENPDNPGYYYSEYETTLIGPAPVPEPATMLLFAFGLLGFAILRKNFRKT